jgi:hypothetical protein
MNKREVSNFIHKFVEWKYHGLIAYSELEKAVIEYPDGRFGFNCHAVLEKYGIGIDQFKKDLSDMLLVFNRK